MDKNVDFLSIYKKKISSNGITLQLFAIISNNLHLKVKDKWQQLTVAILLRFMDIDFISESL